MVSTSFSNRHPPLYAPLSDLSVCNAFGVSVCLFYPIQAGAMASLADLAAATEELSEEVRCIFQPRCLVKPADLYTPRTSAFATDAPGSISSLTRENSPDARRNHFPCVPFSPVWLSRLVVDCRRAGLGRHLIIEREKCKQGTPEMQSPAQRLFSHDPPQQAVSWPQRGVISDNQNEQ